MGLMTLLRTAEPAPPPVEPIDLGSTAAAVTLAHDVAALTGVPLDEVWWSLINVPENLLWMLDSPQGWTALSGYIACDLGAVPLNYAPAVH